MPCQAKIKSTLAKGGLLALSRATAIEFATQNIRVNCTNPGTINTPMSAGMGPKFVKQFRAAIPMGRFGEPGEVAQLALFLASDASSFITGQYVNIDGGMTSRVPQARQQSVDWCHLYETGWSSSRAIMAYF